MGGLLGCVESAQPERPIALKLRRTAMGWAQQRLWMRGALQTASANAEPGTGGRTRRETRRGDQGVTTAEVITTFGLGQQL